MIHRKCTVYVYTIYTHKSKNIFLSNLEILSKRSLRFEQQRYVSKSFRIHSNRYKGHETQIF